MRSAATKSDPNLCTNKRHTHTRIVCCQNFYYQSLGIRSILDTLVCGALTVTARVIFAGAPFARFGVENGVISLSFSLSVRINACNLSKMCCEISTGSCLSYPIVFSILTHRPGKCSKNQVSALCDTTACPASDLCETTAPILMRLSYPIVFLYICRGCLVVVCCACPHCICKQKLNLKKKQLHFKKKKI